MSCIVRVVHVCVLVCLDRLFDVLAAQNTRLSVSVSDRTHPICFYCASPCVSSGLASPQTGKRGTWC